MLAKFKEAKRKEIEILRKAQHQPGWTPPAPRARLDFALALRQPGKIAVIAEYKRASPSRGRIRSDLEVEDVAVCYAENGAKAMSVLTEETYFDGRLEYLDRAYAVCGSLPLLRKDFIFDQAQVYATAATSASALLLIVRLLPDPAALKKLRELAEVCGLTAVVEIFDARDLDAARAAGAKIIQVNARDLDTLKVDRMGTLKLAQKREPDEIWIAASGISEPEQLREALMAGFDAALVGSALMSDPDPGAALARLLGGEPDVA